jgi:hypothetical protein
MQLPPDNLQKPKAKREKSRLAARLRGQLSFACGKTLHPAKTGLTRSI